MAIYTAVIEGDTGVIAVAGGSDQFELTAPANSRVRIRECRLGQYSDFGDAAAEILNVRVIMFLGGDTGGGGNGVAVTPSPTLGSGDTGGGGCIVKRSADVKATDTGLATTVTKTLISDAMNIAAGWWYYPPEEEMIVLEPLDRLVVRCSKATDPLSMAGTLIYEEIGTRGN